jgi:hypothetical protein
MLALPAENSSLWIVLCWLAVWQITAYLCYERGPFDVLTRLRGVLAQFGLQRLFQCFHCSVLWVSFFLVGGLFEWRWSTLVLVLAIAGAASITERWLGGTPSDEERNNG